ncbi:MAG: response regulator [Phormidesmis sp.]
MSKVLVVDDSLAELELMSGYLRQGGYTVIMATDAKEALSKAIEQKPDVVVTDLVMPGMSGLELCRSLKSHADTENLPVVACTSKTQDIDRFWAMKQGINVYITKPFTQEQITNAVKYSLSQ